MPEAHSQSSDRSKRFLLFVSYSCADTGHPFLRKVREYFDDGAIQPHVTYFMAEDNPNFGRDFIEKVVRTLAEADAILPFLSKASELSPWVNQEIGFARARGVPVFPTFDRPHVNRLYGMIQTLDGCPADNEGLVMALFDRIISLSRSSTSQVMRQVPPAATEGLVRELTNRLEYAEARANAAEAQYAAEVQRSQVLLDQLNAERIHSEISNRRSVH